MIQAVEKSILIPIDDSDDALQPIDFLVQLYPQREHINLLLSYLMPPLAPVYRQKPATEAMAEQKRARLRDRNEKCRQTLRKARKILIQKGFPEDFIQEHIQEKELSVAHHACRLADIRKVDAVLVQKRFGSRLEAFLQGDISSALLNHCLISPVWFVPGNANSAKAFVGLDDHQAALRAVDHAAFMLAETPTHLELGHFTRHIDRSQRFRPDQIEHHARDWPPRLRAFADLFREALEMVREAGIDDERIRLSLVRSRGKPAVEISEYCRKNHIGIVVLGHKGSTGTWSFLKNSVTRKLLTDAQNLAIWVNQ